MLSLEAVPTVRAGLDQLPDERRAGTERLVRALPLKRLVTFGVARIAELTGISADAIDWARS